MHNLNVGDILRLNAASMPAKLALVCGDQRLTYGMLDRRTNQTAHALLALGIGAGTRLAVLSHNSLDYVCLYFACAKIGALMVPLNYWQRAEEIRYVLENSEPRMILYDAAFEGTVVAATQDLPRLPISSARARNDAWETMLDQMSTAEPPSIDATKHPHMIVYTSGTTGRPKGAVIGQPRTMADAFSVAGALGVRQNDVFMNYFPPFHVGNWDHQKLYLLVGATVILQPQFDASAALESIRTERVSVILGVPAMFNALLDHPLFEATDKKSVRLIYYAAYDPSGILDRVATAFGAREGRIEMAHIYGLTEGGAFVTICRSHDIFDQWGSIGRPVPGVEIMLMDDLGNRAGANAAGEICVRGPVMTGYWRNDAATAEALIDGWLHTGDIGRANADGFFWIVDRKKDMIRSGGHNVYSKEVEDALGEHDAVAAAAVIGVDDPVYEEAVCAAIVLREGYPSTDATAEAIRAYVRSNRAGYNVPRHVVFLEDLPKNAVGKVQKHVLKEIVRERLGVNHRGQS